MRYAKSKASLKSLSIITQYIFVFGRFLKALFVSQTHDYGIFFRDSLFQYLRDNFVLLQRVFGPSQNLFNYVADRALLVAPFFQSVNPSANEHKTIILNEFVMHCLHVCHPAVEFLLIDQFRNFGIMLRLAMMIQNQKSLVPDVFGMNFEPSRQHPFVKRVFIKEF